MSGFLTRAQLEQHRRRLGLPDTCLVAVIDPGNGECEVYLESFQDGMSAMGLLAQALNSRQDLLPSSEVSESSRKALAVLAAAFKQWSNDG